MEDFEPGASSTRSRPSSLLETRNQLRDLMTKADRSEDLERMLEDILQNKTT